MGKLTLKLKLIVLAIFVTVTFVLTVVAANYKRFKWQSHCEKIYSTFVLNGFQPLDGALGIETSSNEQERTFVKRADDVELIVHFFKYPCLNIAALQIKLLSDEPIIHTSSVLSATIWDDTHENFDNLRWVFSYGELTNGSRGVKTVGEITRQGALIKCAQEMNTEEAVNIISKCSDDINKLFNSAENEWSMFF